MHVMRGPVTPAIGGARDDPAKGSDGSVSNESFERGIVGAPFIDIDTGRCKLTII